MATLVAQSDRGVITGTVSDSTGALIPGVKIVLTNSNTGTNTDTVTTGTGNYTALSLPYHMGTGWIGGFQPVVSFSMLIVILLWDPEWL